MVHKPRFSEQRRREFLPGVPGSAGIQLYRHLNLFNGSSLALHGSRTLDSEVVLWDHSGAYPTNVVSLDAGATLTIGAAGNAHAWGGTLGAPSSPRATSIINNGRVAADLAAGTFNVVADSFTNNGTMESISGGLLSISHLTGNLNNARVTGSGSRLTLDGAYTINTPITATNGTLTLNGSWSNLAGINANGATVNLGGTFTAAGIGTITRSNTPTINISGVLNNAASTLTLSSASNLIGLNGGTIQGGTVTTSGGQRLIQRGGNSTLNGVAVTATPRCPRAPSPPTPQPCSTAKSPSRRGSCSLLPGPP